MKDGILHHIGKKPIIPPPAQPESEEGSSSKRQKKKEPSKTKAPKSTAASKSQLKKNEKKKTKKEEEEEEEQEMKVEYETVLLPVMEQPRLFLRLQDEHKKRCDLTAALQKRRALHKKVTPEETAAADLRLHVLVKWANQQWYSGQMQKWANMVVQQCERCRIDLYLAVRVLFL